MGYDAYACAVIGVRHDPGFINKKVLVDETRRVCGHPIEEGMKHCPECGAPAFTTYPVPIPEYSPDSDDPTLCGFELVNRGEGYYDDPEFIAYWWSGQVSPRTTSFDRIDDAEWSAVKAAMKAKLEPLGLWDEATFGLHVFLVETC